MDLERTMFVVLNSYLFQHKSISIPGLGTIHLESTPASIDIGEKSILPPLYHFRFDKYFDAPDKEFFSYLAFRLNLIDYEVIKWYNEFSYDMRNKIRQDEKVIWQDVGVLKKDYSGNIVFESTAGTPFFLQPVPAQRVIRRHGSHALLVGDREMTNIDMDQLMYGDETVEQKDRWWIFATVVALLSLILLYFYFSSHGWHFTSFGSQQTI
jgi:hypothetical protein